MRGRNKPDLLKERQQQIAAFKGVAERSRVPLICVCGNHDVGNRPTEDSIAKYNHDWGSDYFSFWARGVKCIVLNSQLWNDGRWAKSLAAAQVQWLKRDLALDETRQAKHVLAFCHIPPFVYDQNEPDGYANICRQHRFELLNILAEHGVSHVFCGHYHQNAIGRFKRARLLREWVCGARVSAPGRAVPTCGVAVRRVILTAGGGRRRWRRWRWRWRRGWRRRRWRWRWRR